jgi:hypothetical protein
MVKALANDSTLVDNVVETFLTKAESAIRNRMYPFGLPKNADGTEKTFVVPAKYEVLQCDLASRYILRRGGEGEIKHDENGIGRTYASTNDEDLLMEVMQVI